MIIYKNILGKLKNSGYPSTRLRREKIISESTLTNIRQGKPITLETIDIICKITGLAISDIIEYKEAE